MYNHSYCRQMQPAMPSTQGAPMFPHPSVGTALPTGVPVGPIMTPIPGVQQMAAPTAPDTTPQTLQDTAFLPGFLRTQIGKNMRVQFLIGTNGPLIDRTGKLLGVGANYILMQPVDSDDMITADLYSIKFVDIIR